MDPILLMFSIFTLWRLVRESPDRRQGIMQQIKTAILKEQKTTARGTDGKEEAASFILEDGARRERDERSTFVRTLGPKLSQRRPVRGDFGRTRGDHYDGDGILLMLPVTTAAATAA